MGMDREGAGETWALNLHQLAKGCDCYLEGMGKLGLEQM